MIAFVTSCAGGARCQDAVLEALWTIRSSGLSACCGYDACTLARCRVLGNEKNHDLCTNQLTLIKRGFTLCILYVRNGCCYDHLWIRPCQYGRPVLGRANNRT